jgi:hypothetical protein
METAIISGTSKKDIQLLLTIAQKMGLDARLLDQHIAEDLDIISAIKNEDSFELAGAR